MAEAYCGPIAKVQKHLDKLFEKFSDYSTEDKIEFLEYSYRTFSEKHHWYIQNWSKYKYASAWVELLNIYDKCRKEEDITLEEFTEALEGYLEDISE